MKKRTLLIISAIFVAINGIIALAIPAPFLNTEITVKVSTVIYTGCQMFFLIAIIIGGYSEKTKEVNSHILKLKEEIAILFSSTNKLPTFREGKYDVIKIQYKDEFDFNNHPPIELQEEAVVNGIAKQLKTGGVITVVEVSNLHTGKVEVSATMKVLREKYK